MPRLPLSKEQELKRRKQLRNRRRNYAEIYKGRVEKEKSSMEKLTVNERAEQRKLIARRRSAENEKAYRKRAMLRLRRELKVEKKKVKAASSITKMPSTPEVYRTLRDHGVEVCDSVGNDNESMKGVFTFLKHKQYLHKLQGKYNKTFRLEFETLMANLCKSMPNVANQMKSFLERKIKTETYSVILHDKLSGTEGTNGTEA